jgi:hypothetical protein
MNPILLYPKDEAQAKFFHDAAEYSGAKAINISAEELEQIDDFLFAKKLVERDKKFNPVPMEEFKKMVARKLAEK